jgi:sugar lactone lactonase YvrE
MTEYGSTVVVSGRKFLESPRWRDGEMWLSDVAARQVVAADGAGDIRVLAEVGGRPCGLGFLPDGTALVVSVRTMQVLRLSGLSLYADLSPLVVGGANDMVVDEKGRVYVGSFGYDVFGGAPQAPGNVVLIDVDGSARVVADGIGFPNSMVITSDGTLLLAATHDNRILEYDIGLDGSLVNRRTWAEVDGEPDGIALDSEGALWIALADTGTFQRVRRGGDVADSITVRAGRHAISCGFGGDDNGSLYLTTAVYESSREAALEVARVAVAGT